ncbi:hypothetical protein NDQ57_11835 [Rossellomorea marisflavi]|nr:hypothetical protein [Rossellomorea marisflavi]
MSTNTEAANLDKEAGGGARELTGIYKTIAGSVAVLFSVFAIYTNGLSNIQEIYRNLIFLGLLLLLTFFFYPSGKKSSNTRFTLLDYVFIALSLAGIGYLLFNYSVIHVDRASQAITIDYVFAGITIIVLLEAARRQSVHSFRFSASSPSYMPCLAPTFRGSSVTQDSRWNAFCTGSI